MIQWIRPVEIVTAPTGQLPLSEVRAYMRLPENLPESDRASANALLDTLRAAVPPEYEGMLNRALYRQRRRWTALVRFDRIAEAVLEPHGNLVVRMSTDQRRGDPDPFVPPALDADTVIDTGTRVILDPAAQGDKRLFVEFEYDAGWQPAEVPRPIHEAMLDEIQRRFERHQQRTNQQGEVIIAVRAAMGKLPRAAAAYRVTHDPLPLVPAA